LWHLCGGGTWPIWKALLGGRMVTVAPGTTILASDSSLHPNGRISGVLQLPLKRTSAMRAADGLNALAKRWSVETLETVVPDG